VWRCTKTKTRRLKLQIQANQLITLTFVAMQWAILKNKYSRCWCTLVWTLSIILRDYFRENVPLIVTVLFYCIVYNHLLKEHQQSSF
jgi:hypothetical protein